MATLYDRLLDPDQGSARIANLWWLMALKGVSAIVLGMLAVFLPAIPARWHDADFPPT